MVHYIHTTPDYIPDSWAPISSSRDNCTRLSWDCQFTSPAIAQIRNHPTRMGMLNTQRLMVWLDPRCILRAESIRRWAGHCTPPAHNIKHPSLKSMLKSMEACAQHNTFFHGEGHTHMVTPVSKWVLQAKVKENSAFTECLTLGSLVSLTIPLFSIGVKSGH